MERFRKLPETALAALFTDVLRLCVEADVVKVGVVALDGTKMHADAALAANRTARAIQEAGQLMLVEAQGADDAEERVYGTDRRGDELPEAVQGRRGL